MSELVIRRATTDDAKLISALGITTCYEAYVDLDPSDELARYCMEAFSLEQIAAEIEDKNSIFLIAEFGRKAVGYAKLRDGKEVECLRGKSKIEIQRIYVLEKQKGTGVGKALIEKCSEIAREMNREYVWLGVWDKNTAAQKFYEKTGMKNIGTTDFSDGKNSFINFVFANKI
jgi:ribosomal protein S18 acetylase RimI-like enzyme